MVSHTLCTAVNCTVSLTANDPANICEGIDDHVDFRFRFNAPYVERTTFSARVLGVNNTICTAGACTGASSHAAALHMQQHCIPDMLACPAVVCTDALDGTQNNADVLVVCRKADGTVWQRGEYTCELTASYTGAAACASGSVVATAVEAVAGMRLTARTPSRSTCSSAAEVSAEFAYAVTALGTYSLSYSATTALVPSTCTVTQLSKRRTLSVPVLHKQAMLAV